VDITLYRDDQVRGPDLGLGEPPEHVVAVERDVHGAGERPRLAGVDQQAHDPLREVGAARPHADDVERPLVGGDQLRDLERHPLERPGKAGGVEQLSSFEEVAVGRRLSRRHVGRQCVTDFAATERPSRARVPSRPASRKRRRFRDRTRRSRRRRRGCSRSCS